MQKQKGKMKKLLLVLVTVVMVGVLVIGQEKEDKPSDEEVLKKAGIGTSVNELSKFVLGDENEIKKLIKDLESDSWKIRDAATKKLILMGEPCIPYVKEAEKSDDPEVVFRARKILREIPKSFYSKRQKLLIAIRVLGKSKDKNAIKPLLKLLNHKDYYVSMESAKSLYNFKDNDRVKSCIKELKNLVEKFKKEKKLWLCELPLEKIYHITGDDRIEKELDKIAESKNWYKFRGNACNTGQSRYVATQANRLKWKFKTGGTVLTSPVIDKDGIIYFGSNDRYFYALTPDGKLKWRFRSGGHVFSSPAIDRDGTIYFGSHDYHLYALAPDGKEKWKFKTGSSIRYSSPAIGKDGTIYFGSDDSHLYALSPDGKLKWKFRTGRVVYSSPAIGRDGTIYFGSNDLHLYALTPEGKLKWKFRTRGVILSSPVIDKGGTIYFGSEDNKLYALTKEGKLKWVFANSGGVYHLSSAVIDKDGTIYFGSKDFHLYAIGDKK